MWRNRPYVVPISKNFYYLTTTLLERLENSETVKLLRLETPLEIIPLSSKDEGKQLLLGTKDQDVYKTCFVHYQRKDGKEVIVRLDKLLQNGYELHGAVHGNCLKYSEHIEPLLSGTKLYLSKVETDWPENPCEELLLSDQIGANKDLEIKYIDASKVKLHFQDVENPEKKMFFTYLKLQGLKTLAGIYQGSNGAKQKKNPDDQCFMAVGQTDDNITPKHTDSTLQEKAFIPTPMTMISKANTCQIPREVQSSDFEKEQMIKTKSFETRKDQGSINKGLQEKDSKDLCITSVQQTDDDQRYNETTKHTDSNIKNNPLMPIPMLLISNASTCQISREVPSCGLETRETNETNELEENVDEDPMFSFLKKRKRQSKYSEPWAIKKKPTFETSICPFCQEEILPEDTFNCLLNKGLRSVVEAMTKRKDSTLKCFKGQRVHRKCKVAYTDPQLIENHLKYMEKGKEKHDQFDFDRRCLFCGCYFNDLKPSVRFRNSTVKAEILKRCEIRGDLWANLVKERISLVDDICLANVGCHRGCNVMFKAKLTEKPIDKCPEAAFEEALSYLLSNHGQNLTIKDLIDYMAWRLQNSTAQLYSITLMNEKLLERLRDKISIANDTGIIIFLKPCAASPGELST